ncbi:SET domain-containing protein SmydA-8 [Halyomorpha halys]|uniref:SET domain-containing protein SmydA-8 n=1 Tax=Halyomorpha halys TaxID=286706 RepID=UPI0006D503D4|nr:protein msta isoform X2 [Halyomorpha halys]XP_014279431.1 protein msta isoform X2 [Halyomorpha halys]
MCDELNRLLKQRELLFGDRKCWYINKSNISGSGVFADKSYETGELIFRDTPIVIGPRSSVLPPACVSCMKMGVPLIACSKGCRLPVCSSECENSISHRMECQLLLEFSVKEGEFWSPLLYRALTAFRCLLVSDEDKKLIQCLSANKKTKHIEILFLKKELQKNFSDVEERFLTLSCAVLSGTAFETELGEGKIKASLRGLYPLAGMMNHSCVPNTQHYFLLENNIQTMYVVATCPIPEGMELTTNYSYLFWPTIIRRHFLSVTKEFLCTCIRCGDPTEFDTNLSAVECSCGGLILPLCAIDMKSDWQCGSCNSIVPVTKLPFANPSEILNKSETAQGYKIKYLSIMEKFKKVWDMGHQGIPYKDLKDEELDDKEKNTKELIALNNALKLGDSRMKGLLSLELYETLKEKMNRDNYIEDEEEIEWARDSAKKILNISID